jgi:hypothetical protein
MLLLLHARTVAPFLLLLYALCPDDACVADNGHLCAPLPLRIPLHPTGCLLDLVVGAWSQHRHAGAV